MTDLDIFAYENYRELLSDYYLEQKEKYPSKFSYRFFSKEAGFSTSNFLMLVIKGKRNVSYESIKKIASVIKLRGRRYDYFENLVLFNQASSHTDKTKFYEKLVSFKEYKEARMVTDSEKLYFSKWFFPVVREMVKLDSFSPSARWIASKIKPNIKVTEAQEALDLLLDLGLVGVNNKGKWEQKDAQLTTNGQGASHEVVAYHKKMIHLGFECLGHAAKDRDVSGITMSISPAKFRVIQNKIEEFRDEIQAIVKQPITDDQVKSLYSENLDLRQRTKESKVSGVCQLNLQFFKLTNDL